MKNSLPIFLCGVIILILGAFSISKSKTESSHHFNAGKAFIAVVCGIDSGIIKKEDLQQCPGITTVDASTHKKTHHDVISFEMVFVPKGADARIEKSEGGNFAGKVKELIDESKSGDYVLFRSIKAKGNGNATVSLNAIPLTIE